MHPTPASLPHRIPTMIVVAVVLAGLVMICTDSPALNFWGLVLVVVSPILWGLEYTPAGPAAETTGEVSRG